MEINFSKQIVGHQLRTLFFQALNDLSFELVYVGR